MNITLLRHGKPDCRKTDWLSYADFKIWIKAYEQVDLDKDFVFPQSFNHLSNQHKTVITSDLPRTEQTARSLSDNLIVDSIFREVDFSLPEKLIPFRLRPMMWMTLSRVIWFLGFTCQVDSLTNTVKRAQQSATRLIDLAKNQDHVVLVGHGFFNFFIALELKKKGWKGPLIPNFGYSKGSCYRQTFHNINLAT